MKKNFYLSFAIAAFLFCASSGVYGQGVGINSSGNPPDNSAGLDIDFNNKGMLIPRMTTAQRDAIVNPAQALQIYNLTTNCLELWANGLWQTVWCATCPLPTQPSPITGNASPCVGASQNYSVTNVAGITYNWAFPSGWAQTAGGTTNSVTVTVGSGSGNIQVIPSNFCGNGTAQTLAVSPVAIPTSPTAATHTPSQTQIVWTWNTVPGATGYKYNTVNSYTTALDNLTDTTYTQSGLTCNTSYTLYVWAYNTCGNSSETALTQITTSCCIYIPGNQTFDYSGGIVNFTVPACINSITIQSYGAAGGNGGGGSPSVGGKGAKMVGNLSVNPGDVLAIMVAQAGGQDRGSSGGGGSFIWNTTTGNTLLLAAAGGGGGGASNNGGMQANGGDGQITTTPSNGIGGNVPGGSGGNGGSGAVGWQGWGGAGGGTGWISSGANGGNGGGDTGGGGGSYPLSGTPGAGGSAGTWGYVGGYGGGGGGTYGGGGGGGYNGGGGGYAWNYNGVPDYSGGGGGGGSYYINGTPESGSASGDRTGNGQVIITW